MSVKVSQGIKIKVETNYLSEYSKPAVNHFLFSYRITIENQNPFAVQLLRRHWYIKDTATSMRQVEGEGVVGQTPIIEPGTNYSYESGCNLTSDMGSMRGSYKFMRVDDDTVFEAEIPEFNLTAPWKSN